MAGYSGAMAGLVEAIRISAEHERLPEPVDSIDVTDEGLPGDRYFGRGDITLVEAEALEAFREDTGIELSHAEIRRQVLTTRRPAERPAREALPRRRGRGRRASSGASPAPTSSRSPTRACSRAWCIVPGSARTSCRPAGSRSATRSTRSQTQPHEQVVAAGRGRPAVEADRPVERQRGLVRLVRVQAPCARSRARAPGRRPPPRAPVPSRTRAPPPRRTDPRGSSRRCRSTRTGGSAAGRPPPRGRRPAGTRCSGRRGGAARCPRSTSSEGSSRPCQSRKAAMRRATSADIVGGGDENSRHTREKVATCGGGAPSMPSFSTGSLTKGRKYSAAMALIEVPSGLEGVIAFETQIAEPDKEGGALRYRGVDIEELVGKVPVREGLGPAGGRHLRARAAARRAAPARGAHRRPARGPPVGARACSRRSGASAS